MKLISYLGLTLSLVGLSGCFNVFTPFDHATTDPQLVSAARACLDQGDYGCALKDYEKLSGSDSDTANSEEAFTLYNEAALTMGAFINAFGSGSAGGGADLTLLANALPFNVSDVSSGDSLSALLEIFHGYQKVVNIQDQNLRGIVRIVGAIGIISAILEDMAETRGNLLKSDIATNVSSCESSIASLTCANTVGTNPCTAPNDNVTSGTAISWTGATSTNDPLAQASDSTIVPSFGILYTAIEAAELGLGDLGISSGSAATVLNALTSNGAAQFIVDVGSVSSPCFRALLLNQGIGN